MKTKIPKLVYLEWHDACSVNGWHNKTGVEEFIDLGPCIIRQTGWILSEDAKQLTICCRLDHDNQEYGLLQHIPKTWIKKRLRLDKYV